MSESTEKKLDKSIDFRNITEPKTQERPFPGKESPEYRVFIQQDAFDRMKKHATLSDEIELAGVLLGELRKDARGSYLAVEAIIEGEGANNYGTQVTFTHQTWNHINTILDRDYPKLSIVGWYHTHPGFGVFLSSMDTFIQENFFNLPFQIAVVLETRRNEIGCFAWKEGKPVPVKRMWVGDKEVSLSIGDAEPFVQPKSGKPADKPVVVQQVEGGPSTFHLIFAVIVLVLGLLAGKMWGTSSAYSTIQEIMKAEALSAFETAAVNYIAIDDWKAMDISMAELEESLKADNKAENLEKAQQIRKKLTALIGEYESYKTKIRQEVQRTGRIKDNLISQLWDTQQRASEIGTLVAQLYVSRIVELLGQNHITDPSQLSTEDKRVLQEWINLAMKASPDARIMLDKLLPGFIENLFSNSRPKETAPAKETQSPSK